MTRRKTTTKTREQELRLLPPTRGELVPSRASSALEQFVEHLAETYAAYQEAFTELVRDDALWARANKTFHRVERWLGWLPSLGADLIDATAELAKWRASSAAAVEIKVETLRMQCALGISKLRAIPPGVVMEQMIRQELTALRHRMTLAQAKRELTPDYLLEAKQSHQHWLASEQFAELSVELHERRMRAQGQLVRSPAWEEWPTAPRGLPASLDTALADYLETRDGAQQLHEYARGEVDETIGARRKVRQRKQAEEDATHAQIQAQRRREAKRRKLEEEAAYLDRAKQRLKEEHPHLSDEDREEIEANFEDLSDEGCEEADDEE